jgi:hypothetical protein
VSGPVQDILVAGLLIAGYIGGWWIYDLIRGDR